MFCCGIAAVGYIVEKYDLTSFENLDKVDLSALTKVCLIVGLYSLSALPPFIGFQVKLFYCITVLSFKSIIGTFCLIWLELLAMFAYNRVVMDLLVKNAIELGSSVSNVAPPKKEEVVRAKDTKNPYALADKWYKVLQVLFGRFDPKTGPNLSSERSKGLIMVFRFVIQELYNTFYITLTKGETNKELAEVLILSFLILINVFPLFLFFGRGQVGEMLGYLVMKLF